ncbi:hypothetical protein RUND412_010074, partial [Rhizina undulata]
HYARKISPQGNVNMNLTPEADEDFLMEDTESFLGEGLLEPEIDLQAGGTVRSSSDRRRQDINCREDKSQ